jgi:DNA-binding CsgD family transcriptional regulator
MQRGVIRMGKIIMLTPMQKRFREEFLKGKSNPEIALALGIKVGAARSLIDKLYKKFSIKVSDSSKYACRSRLFLILQNYDPKDDVYLPSRTTVTRYENVYTSKSEIHFTFEDAMRNAAPACLGTRILTETGFIPPQKDNGEGLK